MPVISNLAYTVTDSTIVATWTTNTLADSNLTASGKAAIDNGVAATSLTHQCIVTGLSPNTNYSCVVTSGGTSSTPQNVTTNTAVTRTAITSAAVGAPTITSGVGDTFYNCVSNDGICYTQVNDGTGLQGAGGAAENIRIDKFTNESTLVGSQVNLLTAYGIEAATNGTDGPASAALTNKSSGLFAMNGSLFLFQHRQFYNGAIGVNSFYQNICRSDDHGATWNNFTAPAVFGANGLPPYPPSPAPYMFTNPNFGFVCPVMYGADDGTLGYNTSGNQIDGANGWVYMLVMDTAHVNNSTLYMARMPRIRLQNLDYSATQYWIGPSSPSATDFVTDSNWQSGVTGLTSIYTDAGSVVGGGAGRVSRPSMTYIPAMNYYLMITWYRPQGQTVTSNTVWNIVVAPTPAGPWKTLASFQNQPNGWYNPCVMHRTAINNNSSTTANLSLIYQGDFNQGAAFYHPVLSSLTLRSGSVPNTFIQGLGASARTTGATITLAYPSNVTAGDLLIVGWRYNGVTNTISVTNVTDTLHGSGVPWHVVYDAQDGGTSSIKGGWAYFFATLSGACTVSVNLSASAAGGNIAIVAERGPNTFRSSTAVKTGSLLGAGNIVSNTFNTTAGDLVIGVSELTTSGPVTASAPFTLRAQATQTTGNADVNIADLLSDTGTVGQKVTFPITAADNGDTAGVGAFFFTPPATSSIINLPAMNSLNVLVRQV